MKFLKYILFLLLILIIGLAIYIAVQPSDFEVTRTRTVNAPVAVVYKNVSDFKNWEAWSPWKEKQPESVITLGEKTDGIGGTYAWTDKDGSGSMKTLDADLNKSINQEMQFGDYHPSKINWSFESTSEGKTNVTWQMLGEKTPFVFKGFAALSGGFDKMIGPDFERGLEKLDSIVVKSMEAYETKIDGVTEYGGGFFMYKTTSANGANISQLMGKQYGEIMGYMAQNNIVQNGMPFTIYNEMNPDTGNIIMSNAIPILNKVNVTRGSEVLCGYIPKTKALKTTLKGNYNNLPKAWEAAMTHLAENDLTQSNLKPFEIYTNDPGLVPNPADWVTEIYIPIIE